jgi:hypothetical protein
MARARRIGPQGGANYGQTRGILQNHARNIALRSPYGYPDFDLAGTPRDRINNRSVESDSVNGSSLLRRSRRSGSVTRAFRRA